MLITLDVQRERESQSQIASQRERESARETYREMEREREKERERVRERERERERWKTDGAVVARHLAVWAASVERQPAAPLQRSEPRLGVVFFWNGNRGSS